MTFGDLPAINACLNGASALFRGAGYVLISHQTRRSIDLQVVRLENVFGGNVNAALLLRKVNESSAIFRQSLGDFSALSFCLCQRRRASGSPASSFVKSDLE